LQSKLDAAAAWLDRVRRAIPKASKPAGSAGGGGGGPEKAGLEEVRELLGAREQTGVLLEGKEVDAVAGVLETADDWLGRVRAALEGGSEPTLMSLSALLDEAVGIPVAMEEYRVLQVGIKARNWKVRVKAGL
ncbi:unnamed protein product, partial [Phaeothamnion confervicola]